MQNAVSRKLMIQKILAIMLSVTGITLLIYMITVEDEPGAVPLILIILGIVWYVLNQNRNRTQSH
jgi:hypothetical protein